MTGQDDLSPWNDDPLVRALRAPGTPEELTDEADYLATFRAAQASAPTPISSARVRRLGRRLGGGGTAVVVTIALGAGAAAAAYTQNLPDPVQRAVHGVLGPVGVPAPDPEPQAGGGAPRDGAAPQQPATPDAEATDAPTTPGGSASATPSSPSAKPSDRPSDTPTVSPSESPSTDPSPSPTTPPAAPPSSVTLVGTSHRAAPDEQLALSGLLATADGSPVPGASVTLVQKQGRSWVPVTTAASDDQGAVSIATPTLARTSVFRLAVGDELTSKRWRVVLVPEVTVVSQPDGSGIGVVATARGGQPGDRISLLQRRPGRDVVVGRARLGTDLSATFRVAPPRGRVRFVAALPRTRAHAVARARLVVRPLRPVAMSASVADDTPGPRDPVTVTGTVSGPEGVALPGRRVRLLLRERGGRWQRVGSATSDSSGTVAIPVGAIQRSSAVRLRVGKVRSAVVRLRLQPEWSVSVAPDGPTAVVSGTAIGGAPGDEVLLRRLEGGRLRTVQQGTLGPAGAVRFVVDVPARGTDRYRLVLRRTPEHLKAVAPAAVRATP